MTTSNSMKAIQDYTSAKIQKDLAAGILKQATQDLRRFHNRTSAVERELYFDAYHWFRSNDYTWPFSFVNICQLLDLDPEAVREDLTDGRPVGTFGLWNRRCRRAAGTFKTFLGHAFTTEANSIVIAVDPVPLTDVPTA
jgi:hypothetical protein